jgi:hypothetical protein
VGKSLNRSTRSLRGRVVPGAAFAVTVICLLGQLGSVAHEATERHVRCAEHGELSHVGAESSAGGSHTLTLGVEGQGDRSRSVADQATTPSTAHEHCAFLFSGRRDSSRPILLVVPAPEPALPPAPGAAPILAAPAERILLSAPKIAPPFRTAASC